MFLISTKQKPGVDPKLKIQVTELACLAASQSNLNFNLVSKKHTGGRPKFPREPVKRLATAKLRTEAQCLYVLKDFYWLLWAIYIWNFVGSTK